MKHHPQVVLREGQVCDIRGQFVVAEARQGRAVLLLTRTMDGEFPLPIDDEESLGEAARRWRTKVDKSREQRDTAS